MAKHNEDYISFDENGTLITCTKNAEEAAEETRGAGAKKADRAGRSRGERKAQASKPGRTGDAGGSAAEAGSAAGDASGSAAEADAASVRGFKHSGFSPLDTVVSTFGDGVRGARVVIGEAGRAFSLFDPEQARRRKKARRDKRHARTRVAFFRFSYYDVAFKYFVEQVLDADFVALPPATKRTFDLGSRYSSDSVCAPFKHILGDYIEALELGADVLVQFAGPCRLGYYGELQQSILRDLGYEFDMLNFSTVTGKPAADYIKICRAKVNPNVSVPHGARQLLATFKMIEALDEVNDFYLANAGFECEPGSFVRTRDRFFDAMRTCTCERDIVETRNAFLDEFRNLPVDKPARPLRVGIVGEFFTAPDEHSNLQLERKLLDMGVEVHRTVSLTNRALHYNEKNLRASVSDYVTYDMGPTSSLTLAAALKYAQEDFDGVVHVKSSGCTPEIDCMTVLARIASDYRIPVLYLSYDSQTSDTGLDTRLEAFYDMLAMKKERG
ncbi:hypothetical protein [Xiamenia xianingshaonis]|uniref:hypothetical protein n=1 Tax=Xiamenia xianingshaonis TaxID=2682776 RepID=UPI0021BD4969|nr:hypothetical protein [Xiamenia xianingshaonis]